MIDVRCKHCGTVYHSEETHRGKQLQCTKCGQLVSIGLPSLPSRPPVVQPSPILSASPPNRDPHKLRRPYVYVATTVATLIVVASAWIVVNDRDRRPSSGTAPISDIEESATPTVGLNRNTMVNEGTGNDAPNRPPTAGRGKTICDLQPADYNSLPSGTIVKDEMDLDGNGELQIENGTEEDAVVQVTELATMKSSAVFVQKRSSAHIVRVPEGEYELAFTSGLDWVESGYAFTWCPSYFRFERVLGYTEKMEDDGVRYKVISVTLHPVRSGNIRKIRITRAEFLKGIQTSMLPAAN